MRSVLLPLAALLVTGVHAQVLFSDDFNDGNAAGWQEFDGQFSVVNGEYRVQSQSFCGDARAVSGSPAWTDYAVDLDFYIESTAANRSAAILFRVQDIASGCDAGQYYQFYAYPTLVGLCRMNYSQGACQILATAPFVTTNFTWHHARIEIEGTIATAYIDGQQVLTHDGLTAYASGRIGVKAVNGNTNVYDNVVVSALPIPTIATVVPAHSSLSGGVPVTIGGSGFTVGTTVTVGGIPLQNPTTVNSSTITGLTPALAAVQAADVVVTSAGGSTALLGAIAYDHAVLIAPSPLTLGSTVEVRVASYPNKPLILLFDPVPGPTSLGYLGTAAIGLSPALVPIADFFGAFTGNIVDPAAITDLTGQWTIQAQIPNDPQLGGLTFYGQAYTFFSFFPLPPNQYFFFSNLQTVYVTP